MTQFYKSLQTGGEPLPFDPLNLSPVGFWRNQFVMDGGVPTNVNEWVDESGNGNNLEYLAGTKATVGSINSVDTMLLNGSGYYQVPSSTTKFKFMHDGTGFTAYILFRTNTNDPAARYMLFCTKGTGFSPGISVDYNNSTATKGLAIRQSNASSSKNIVTDDAFTASATPKLLTINYYQPTNVSNFKINDVFIDNNFDAFTFSTANQNANLIFGAFAGGTLPANTNTALLAIYGSFHAASVQTQFYNWAKSIYGIA